MDEKKVMKIAKFYDDTRTWRGELELAGCSIEAKYLDYYHDLLLTVDDNPRKLGWEVSLDLDLEDEGGFKIRSYRGTDHDVGMFGHHHFKTAEEVMDFLSEKLRER